MEFQLFFERILVGIIKEFFKNFVFSYAKFRPEELKNPNNYNQYHLFNLFHIYLMFSTSLVGILKKIPPKFPRNLNLTIVFVLKSHVTLAFLFVIHPGNTIKEKQKQGYFA